MLSKHMYNTICMDTDQEFKAVLAKKEARWEERIRELFDQTSREKAELQNQLAVVRNEADLYEEDFRQERRDRVKAHDIKEEERVKYEEQLDQFARQIEIYVVEVSSLEFKNGDLSKKLTHSRERHDAEIKKIKRVKNEQISRLSKELEALKQREVDLAELRDKSRVDLEKEFVDVKLENESLKQSLEQCKRELSNLKNELKTYRPQSRPEPVKKAVQFAATPSHEKVLSVSPPPKVCEVQNPFHSHHSGANHQYPTNIVHPSYYNGRGVPYNDRQHRGFEQTCPPYLNPVRDPMESQEPPLRARTPPYSQGQPVVDSPFGSQTYVPNRPSPTGIPSPSPVVPLGAYSAHPRPVPPYTATYGSASQNNPPLQGNIIPTSDRPILQYQPQRSNLYQYPTTDPRSRPSPDTSAFVNADDYAHPSGYQLHQQPQPAYQYQQSKGHWPPSSQSPEVQYRTPNPYQPADNHSPPLSQSPSPVYRRLFNKHGSPYSQPTQPNQDHSPNLSQSPILVNGKASRSPLREEQPLYDVPPLDEDVQRQLQQPYYQNPPLETVLDQLQLEPTEKTPLIPPRHIPAAEPVNTYTPYGQNAHYSPPPVPSPMNYRPQGNVQQASMYEYHGNRRYSTEEESSTLPEGQPLDDYYRGLKLEGASNGKQTFKEAISSSANRETPTEQPQARRMGDMTATQTPSGKTEDISGEADENIDLEFNSEIDEASPKQNFLERNLDDEIFHFNEDFSRDRAKQETNEKSPYDSNLKCRFCSKVHRIGEIQKFKRHDAECRAACMKNSEEPPVLDAKSMAEALAGDTQPFSRQHSSTSSSVTQTPPFNNGGRYAIATPSEDSIGPQHKDVSKGTVQRARPVPVPRKLSVRRTSPPGAGRAKVSPSAS